MKFSAPYGLLERAIATVSANPTDKMINDVCQYILIETNKDNQGITLTKTDFELHITSSTKANVSEAGRALVHGENIAGILRTYKSLKKSDDCQVVLECNNNKLSVSFTDNKKYEPAVFSTRDPDDFAPLDEFVDEIANCEIKSAQLRDYFSKALVAISKHETNPEYGGAFFKFKGDAIEIVSSTRQEVAVIQDAPVTVNYSNGINNAFSLIPRKTLETTNRILKGDEKVSISISLDMVKITGSVEGVGFSIVNNTYVVDSALDGVSMIPDSAKIVISVAADELRNALSHMESIMDKAIPNRITLVIDPTEVDTIKLRCKSPRGEIPGVPIEATLEKTLQDSTVLVLNDQKLQGMLKVIRSKKIKISFDKTGSTCTFKGDEEPFFTLISGSCDSKDGDLTVTPKATKAQKISSKANTDDVANFEDLSKISDTTDLNLDDIQEIEL